MPRSKIKTIDVIELKKRMDLYPDLILVDVRELYEWKAMHIAQAIHIPGNKIQQSIVETVSDKSLPIYIHCQAGVRSLYAAHSLIELGYVNVYSVNGGIIDWANQGYPIVVEG
ncbi:MAG: rhodanese-like domain-containing protein [Legionella sp.]|jgi:rhodanese-related sulfurtransferase